MSISLWFLREGNVLRCYAHEYETLCFPKFPSDKRIVSGESLNSGSVCELLDGDGKVCGIESYLNLKKNSHAVALFTGCANAQIINDDKKLPTYVISFGITSAELSVARNAFDRAQMTVSCGFDGIYELDDGSLAMSVYGWYHWEDKENGILAYDGEHKDGAIFAYSIERLESDTES